VADVAYFIGEDAPKMTGIRKPELPKGRDFDYINAEVIEKSLSVSNGVLTLPHGTTYRVLVLPELDTMRPNVLRKIRDLVRAGATVLGPRPSRSPSLEDFPRCDRAVQTLARELWGNSDGSQPGTRRFGKGSIIWGKALDTILAAQDCPPDFESSTRLRFTHRRNGDADIYFVANPKAEPLTTTAAFRVGGKAPELWRPDSGKIDYPAVYDIDGEVVKMPLTFAAHGSVFVVFRKGAESKSQRIVSVRRNGEEVLGTQVTTAAPQMERDTVNNFTLSAWVRPAHDTTLVKESNVGVVGMGEKRNDLLVAPHGSTFGGSGHAGWGLAVGTNGVCVFEHGANYFAPTLVHATALSGWAHVTVLYRDGRPSLYLDGKRVHSGLQSQHMVHSGVLAGASAQFRGQAGVFQQFARALSDAEVQALVRTMTRPDRVTRAPAIRLMHGPEACRAEAALPGDYELVSANGQRSQVRVADIPSAQTLIGPWEVRFTPGWHAPQQIRFEELISWPQHPHEGIKLYSGKALYSKTFHLTEPPAAHPELRLVLDLGAVRDMATVRVNGRDLGTLWLAPWRIDVTDAVQAGANRLEVEVVNTWNNRLVGDAALPEAQRRTFLLVPAVKRGGPLLPAGLLGPVTLQTMKDFIIPWPE